MSTSFDKECSGASLLPNIAMAFCHLSYLDPHASEFFFVGIDDAKKGRPIKVWGNVSFTAVQSELVTYNQEGYGIYVTVNEIDHSGSRKESNVTRIRSIFEDNDTVGAAPVSYTIQPSFEVESSPGKFHRYWLNSDSVSMNEFKEMAKSLVRTCGSDPACKDPPRVLRLAGFYHRKKIPVMTVLREAVYDQSKNTFLRYEPLNTALNPGECTKLVRYRCEALKTAFPPLQPDEAESPLCYDYSHISLGDEEPRIFGAVTALSTDCAILLEYDPWLRCGMALHSALPDGRGCDLWKIASSGLPNYDEAEIERKWASFGAGSGCTLGTLYYLAGLTGWKYQEVCPPGAWPQLDYDTQPEGLTSEAMDGWRFAKHIGKDFVYTSGLGWFEFDGVRLRHEREIANSKRVVNKLFNIIINESRRYNQKVQEALRKHASQLERNSGLNAAIIASQPHLRIPDDLLDSNPDILCCKNGILNLVTGELKPGVITDFVSKQAHAHYLGLQAPEPPLFVEQMNWLFDDHPEVIQFVQKWLGYSLSGRVNEHLFPEFIGEGGNGKSKLFEAIMQVFGDYGVVLNAEVFHDTSSSICREATMEFMGKRLAYAAETKEKGVLNEQFIKMAVGNDKMVGRVLYHGLVSFRATHKLMLVTNFKTIVVGKDHSIWRRLVNIHTTERKLTHDDKERGEKIKAEADLILSWLVRGFQRYLKEGLSIPEKLKKENEAFREEMNLLKRFIDENCYVRSNEAPLFILKSELVKSYQIWLKDEGYDTIRPTRTTVDQEMKRMGYEDYQGNKGRVWRGVVMTSEKLRAMLTAFKNKAGEERAEKCGM